MAEKETVTNAMRLMRGEGVDFTTLEYEVDPSDLSGVSAADHLGLPRETVLKTLVLRGEKKGVLVCVLPVELEIDLKKLAKAAGEKKVELVPLQELLPLTGYVRGGCSPVGMKKKYPTFLDETALLCERISVSAGQRGVQMLLRPEELLRVTQAKVCDLSM